MYQSISSQSEKRLGKGWCHNYEWSLDLTTYSTKIISYTGDGAIVTIAKEGENYFYPLNVSSVMTSTTNSFVQEQPDGTEYHYRANGLLDRIQDAWGNQVVCSYDSNNRLEAVTHSNGRQILYSNVLDSACGEWRVGSISVSDGPAWSFEYNSDGQFTQIVENVAGVCSTSAYQYADGFLTNKVNDAGHKYTFGYESDNGTLTGKGTYLDVDGWYEHTVDYVTNNVTDVGYVVHGTNQIFRYARGDNNILHTLYGPAGSTQDVTQVGTRYKYASNWLDKTEETLFDETTGSTWSQWMLYDDKYNATNISVGYNTSTQTHQWSLEYESSWSFPTAIENAEGHRTEITYTNASPLVLKEFYSDTESYDTHFAYTTNGLLRFITNANSHVIECTYDNMGNLSTAFAELGPVVSNSSSTLGFVTRSEILSEDGSSTGRIIEYGRDAKGRVTAVTYADGLVSSNAYNALDYLTKHTDRAGNITDLTYAPTKRLTSFTQYLKDGGSNIPVRVAYNYDKQFNTLSITEPRNRYVESYQLDIQDRVRAVTNIENQDMTLDYSVGSFVTNVARFDDSELDISYDSAGRKERVVYSSSGNQQLSTINYAYYADSKLKSISDGTSSISNCYDRLNRLTNIVTTIGNQQSSICNAFDPVGNITNTTLITDSDSLITSYTYDAAERLKEISRKGTEAQSFTYSYNPANGRVSSITNLESGLVTSYGYDLMDRTTNISYRTASGSLIRSMDYRFDALGMITNAVTSDDSSQLSVKSYQYDSINRLTAEAQITDNGSQVTGYTYDLAGNRLAKYSGSATVNYQLGAGNRLASWTATSTNSFTGATRAASIGGSASETIGTDPRWGERSVSNSTRGVSGPVFVDGTNFIGSIILQPGTQSVVSAISDVAGNVGYASNSVALSVITNAQYLSDTAGCLTNISYTGTYGFNTSISLDWDERYRLTSVSSACSVVDYSYDVYGRRTSCSVGSASQTNTTSFVYDGHQIVADLDESGNLLRTYVWGQSIDNLLAFTDHTTSNTYYAIKDHQNSVLALVDASGSVVESYEYDAWGRTRVFDAAGKELAESAIGNRYCFQGREIDWATGLYYFRARWYNPVSGRWLSKDPIGISGGLNLYAFCGNNPVNFVDPLGLQSYDLGIAPRDNSTVDANITAGPDLGPGPNAPIDTSGTPVSLSEPSTGDLFGAGLSVLGLPGGNSAMGALSTLNSILDNLSRLLDELLSGLKDKTGSDCDKE